MTGITPGDALVAISVVSAVLVAYHAGKAQFQTMMAQLQTFSVKQEGQSKQLAEQGADIRYMARKTASIEGKVFGRRIEDRMPSERTQQRDEDPFNPHDVPQHGLG